MIPFSYLGNLEAPCIIRSYFVSKLQFSSNSYPSLITCSIQTVLGSINGNLFDALFIFLSLSVCKCKMPLTYYRPRLQRVDNTVPSHLQYSLNFVYSCSKYSIATLRYNPFSNMFPHLYRTKEHVQVLHSHLEIENATNLDSPAQRREHPPRDLPLLPSPKIIFAPCLVQKDHLAPTPGSKCNADQ